MNLGRAWSVLFPRVPAERLAALRILIGGFATVYLLARAPELTGLGAAATRSFEPVGPIRVLDAPLPAPWPVLLYLVAVASGLAATLGFRYRLSGPVFGVALCWVLSYRNSWGMIFHTENLLVAHGLIVGLCRAADAWSLDARRTPPLDASGRVLSPSGRYGWPILAMQLVVVLSYVVAGVAKLRAAGLEWALGHELQSHIAFDAVRKLELGSTHSPLGAALVSHSWVFAPLAWVTLLFELGAPLALLGGAMARAWCAIAWGFHFAVLLLMAIVFPYPLLGLAYAPFFAVEILWRERLRPRLSR